MCDCGRALELLSLELDGQLTPEERGELEAHLAGCGECRRAAEELRQLHTILPELEEEVPDGLHQAIMDRVRAEKVVPLSGARRPSQLRRWASLAAAFAVILLGAGTWRLFQGAGGSGAPAAGVPEMAAVAAAPEGADTVTEGGAVLEAAPAGGGAADGAAAPRAAAPAQSGMNQAVAFDEEQEETAPKEGAAPDEETTETLRANCAAWLADSTFDQKDRVDTALISVVQVTEGGLAAAVCDDESAALLDGGDWAVTLGDTVGHDYAVLLCDSETLAVLGYVPLA